MSKARAVLKRTYWDKGYGKERDQYVIDARRRGETYLKIAIYLDVSPQRAQQIMKRLEGRS